MPNRLIDETSPYLLQHANNPVDWYPWGSEALQRARDEDRPILLSVGYSACHWCHVMERESFEDPDIAALMNESFVCIKVDREERPDIDSIYMSAVQAMSGSGGWPMTVFLTPMGEPFYGGTYFPPEDRHGMPGFRRVLTAIRDTYRDRRGDVIRTKDQLLKRLRAMTAASAGVEPLTADILTLAQSGLAGSFDERHGGIGSEPKFPQPMIYEFLLRQHLRTGDSGALEIVELTLHGMALGGIYDHLGGGFHRYSTDRVWLVPHFEKMLYDNALLAKLYLHAYQVTRKPLYLHTVEATLDYVTREMTSPEAGFYSAQDADSEGVEGKFFVWHPQEVVEVLGREDAEVFNRYFGVTEGGNFEGGNILHVREQAPAFAEQNGMDEQELGELLSRAKRRLMEVRERRVHPERDDKVLTGWNGLMLGAFAEASAVLGRADYAATAERNASFLLEHMRPDGRLLRTYKDGQARLNGYLEDYATLISGLLALHEATFGARWLEEAIGLGHEMVMLFWDEAAGRFYDTGFDHEELIVRPRDYTDNAIPSGSSTAADVLLRLALITGDRDLERRATAAMRSVRELMVKFPGGAGHWLCALEFYLSRPKEIAIVGDRSRQDTGSLLAEVYRRFLPNRVLIGKHPSGDLDTLPLMQGRKQQDGKATAYVCQNYVCKLPVTSPEALRSQLGV